MEGSPLQGVAGIVVGPEGVRYHEAFGDVALDSVFRLWSMTKPVTSVAAMQLVESGALGLGDPVTQYLPEMAPLQVLRDGALSPASRPPTIGELLTHTGGYAHALWDGEFCDYWKGGDILRAPLVSEPGTRWQYSHGLEVLGRVIERVSGLGLEEYFQQRIFSPLGMTDTTYFPTADQQKRLVARGVRQADGTYVAEMVPVPEKIVPHGGAGLYGTAQDYGRFLQMFLRGGEGLLRPESIAEMGRNQIGRLQVRSMKTTNPAMTLDFTFHTDCGDGFGYGFQINEAPYAEGRPAGCLAWAGVWNTYFWIDPVNRFAAAFFAQTSPLFDDASVQAFAAFERAVYQSA